MRFALALCVVVGCTLCGNAMASAARRRAKLLNRLIHGIRVLRVHMIRMLEPVDAALAGSECPALEQVGSVGAVFAPAQAPLLHPLFDFFAPYSQQRPDDQRGWLRGSSRKP